MSPATPPPAAPPAQATGTALELLVHGVGGATPQEVLGDPRTIRVTGDATAAVYRRTDDVHGEKHPERYRDEPVAEAYCWSGLTSGNSSRALWLLLLPFMVVNLAHWMRPTATGRTRAVRLYGVLVRLVALSLTVLLTAAACEVALDLVAWQCAGTRSCAERRSWLGFLSAHQGSWWSQPGRRIAFAALLPTALVGLLWYLSHRTWSAYESQGPLDGTDVDENDPDGAEEAHGPGAPAPDSLAPDAPSPLTVPTPDADGARGRPPAPVRPALGRPGFWYGRRLVARLRAAHTAIGFLTVAAAVTGAAARYDRTPDSPVPQALGAAVEGGIVLCALVAVWVVCRRGRSERVRDTRLDCALTTYLPGSALALLALAVLHASWSRPAWQSSGSLPGETAFRLLALVQGVLVVALALVARSLHRRTPEPRTILYGLGGPAVAMLACALGGVMTGGVAQRVADWLDGPGTPGMDQADMAGPPVLLSWQASVIPVLLLLLLCPVVVLVVRTARTARRLGPLVEAEYAPEPPDRARTRRIARIRATAALTDSAPWIVGVVSAATLLLGAGAIVGSWRSNEVPGRAADGSVPLLESLAEAAQSTGSWLVGLGFVLFVAGGRRAYKDASARRTIGILWDVGTFWPRAAHPFAPPCYAERAVPDLASRMSAWTTTMPLGRLVISGHSQGSVLAASAVWQLPDAARSRVALLTYGSPLERLYGRWFPAYFGPVPLLGLHRSVHCWRNLWRATDPIGGPVRISTDPDPGVDRGPLKDPLAYGRTTELPLPEPILGHSDYQADPAFAEQRAALLEELGPIVPRQAEGQPQGPAEARMRRDGHKGSSGRSSG